MILAAALAGSSVQAIEIQEGVAANPIRRVVTMLQNLQKKVEEEGERDEELHGKFMCYCKNGAGDLAKSIADAETKIADLGSSAKDAAAQKMQTDQDLVSHRADRAAAKEAQAQATAVRKGRPRPTLRSRPNRTRTSVQSMAPSPRSRRAWQAHSFRRTRRQR
jgi:hypothetical protein